MKRKFSSKVKKIISVSRDEAIRLGNDFIGAEHLLLGIIREKDVLSFKVLDSFGVDFSEVKFKIEENSNGAVAVKTDKKVGNIMLNKEAEEVLKVTFLEAKLFKNEKISPEHLLLSILKHKENIAAKILSAFDVDHDSFSDSVKPIKLEPDQIEEHASLSKIFLYIFLGILLILMFYFLFGMVPSI